MRAVVYALMWLLLAGCAEPYTPPAVSELPEPCEWPRVLDLAGHCVPAPSASREER